MSCLPLTPGLSVWLLPSPLPTTMLLHIPGLGSAPASLTYTHFPSRVVSGSKELQYSTATQPLPRTNLSSHLQATHSTSARRSPLDISHCTCSSPGQTRSHLIHRAAQIKKETTLTDLFPPPWHPIHQEVSWVPPLKYKPTQMTTAFQQFPH